MAERQFILSEFTLCIYVISGSGASSVASTNLPIFGISIGTRIFKAGAILSHSFAIASNLSFWELRSFQLSAILELPGVSGSVVRASGRVLEAFGSFWSFRELPGAFFELPGALWQLLVALGASRSFW